MFTLSSKYTQITNKPSSLTRYNFKVTDTYYQKLYQDTAREIYKIKESRYLEQTKKQGYKYVTVFDEYTIRYSLLKRYKFNINLELYLRRFILKYPNIDGFDLFLLELGTPTKLFLTIKV